MSPDAATGGQGGAALRASLLRTRAPVVMIRTSAAVEAACARSGLTAAELLRPFGLRAPTTLNVPIRTAGDHPPYRLHDLPLRMVHWSAVRVCDNAKDADDALAAQVTQVRDRQCLHAHVYNSERAAKGSLADRSQIFDVELEAGCQASH
jgi:hypothetical protein